MKNLAGLILSTGILIVAGASELRATDAPPPLPPLPNLPGDTSTTNNTNSAATAPNGMKELTLPPVGAKGSAGASSISSSPLPPLPTPGQDPFANMPPPTVVSKTSNTTSKPVAVDAFPVPPLPSSLGGPATTTKVTPAPIIVTADDEDKTTKGKGKKKGKKHRNGKTKKLATKIAPKTPSMYYISEPLPEAIYKKSYDRLNRHLPTAYYESDYDTLVFVTAAHDDVNGLHSLLDNGRNVELIDTAGDTPLLVAVKNGAINTTRLLLAHRANPNVKDRNGMTPLQIATKKGNSEMQHALEQMGASPACAQVSSAQ